MKNFNNVFRVYSKIQFLGEGHEKRIYIGDFLKRAGFRKFKEGWGLARKRWMVFLREGGVTF